MKLYNYKYTNTIIVGIIISLIASIVLVFALQAFVEYGMVSLNLFLFLLALTKQSEENNELIMLRYSSLLALFIITFATFISFGIVSLLTNSMSIDYRGILSLSILLLLFYHTIFKVKIAYSALLGIIKDSVIVKILYVLLSIAIVFLNLYLFFEK